MANPESRTLREAVARFDDPKQLETAVSELQSHGFDRADISFIAREGSGVSGQLTQTAPDMRHAAEDPDVARDAAVDTSDVQQGRTLATSMAAVIAAFAAAGFTVATGGAALLAAGVAAAAGAGVGAVGAAIGWQAGDSEQKFFDEQLARGGVLLWVRTRDAAAEQRALDILRRCAGVDPHIHDMPATA